MEQKNVDIFKTMRILHLAFSAGLGIFLIVLLGLSFSSIPPVPELNRELQIVSIILAVAGLYFGNKLFRKKILQLRESNLPAKKKLESINSAYIAQWALTEGPAFFAGIGFYLTGNYSFFAMGLALTIYLAVMLAPKKLKIIIYLQLNEADMREIGSDQKSSSDGFQK